MGVVGWREGHFGIELKDFDGFEERVMKGTGVVVVYMFSERWRTGVIMCCSCRGCGT